jgi:hypothetical protein
MAKKIAVGVSNLARNVKSLYTGREGVAKKVGKGYIGVSGVAKQFYPSITISLGSSSTSITVGQTVTLTAIVNSGSVTWNTVTGLTPNGLTATYTPTSTGTYTIIVTSTIDNTKIASVSITVATPAIMTVNGHPVYAGETYQLYVSIGQRVAIIKVVTTTYTSWNKTGGQMSITGNTTGEWYAETSGTYTVTLTVLVGEATVKAYAVLIAS